MTQSRRSQVVALDVTLGWAASPTPPPTDTDLANVDCLMCHSPGYSRTVAKNEDGKAYLTAAEGVDILAAAQNAQRPTNATCGFCHLRAAGGPNFKHGDFPTPETDVHVAGGLQCVDCHQSSEHKIGGGGYMIAQEATDIVVACENCHSNAPHEGDEAGALNSHTARVACQTCHIPLIARDPGLPTQMTRDYTQPVLNEERGLYGPKIGKEGNLVPTYMWWDHPRMETPPKPVGSIDDAGAKITPWKPMEVTVPFDAGTHTPIYIKQGAYQIKGDLEAGIMAGLEASGQEYSGSWEPVTELMYFDAQHQVAPADQALYCDDCHAPGGRIDFAALGYTPERVSALTSMAAPAAAEEEKPPELPATGADLSLLPWLLAGAGGLMSLGGGLLLRKRR